MPNWKKVIVSGSDAILSNITASSNISASGYVSASYFIGNGSQLTNLPAAATPTLQQVTTAGAATTNDIQITGSAIISGSLELTGSLDVDLPDIGNITFTTRKGGFKVTSGDVGYGTLTLGPAGYNTGYSSSPGLYFNSNAIIRTYTSAGQPIQIGKDSGQYVSINKPGYFFQNNIAALEVHKPANDVLALRISGSIDIIGGDISGSVASTASFGHFIGDGSGLTNLKAGSDPGRIVFTTTDGEITTENGFSYNSSTNQLTVDSINVVSFTSSFITSSTIESSGSHTFGDSTSDTQTLVGSILMSGSAQLTGSFNIDGNVETSTTGKFIGPLEGNADTSTKIASITNSNIVQLTSTQALTNKDLTGAGNTFPTFNQDTTGTAAGLSSTLVVGSGGTGLTALGSANQVLSVNAAGNALEYTTPTTGDVTEVTSATTNQITVANSTGPNPSISAVTAAIANAGTGLATADQIHTFVTTQTDETAADTSGNAATSTKIASITNSNIVQLTSAQSLTNKDLTGAGNTFPTFNQNTTGTAAGLSSTLVVGSGGTGLTALGSANQVLTVNGAGNALEYTTPTTGTVTSVTGTTAITSSGGNTPNISIPAADDSTNGFLTMADWTTFNSKGSGDVTEVTSATTNQITVANSTGPDPAISAVTAAISNGGTGLATADQIHTFVTTQTDDMAADTSGTAASLSATLITGRGGTGLTTIGTAGQVLTVNAGANGLEYTTISAGSGTVTSVGTTGTVNGITLTGGDITTTGTVTLGGTLAISNNDWSGDKLSVANGGTGASTFTAGRVLIGNGTSAITTDSGFTYSSNKLTTEALKITSVSEDEETSKALMIDNASAGDVVFRTLGTNAFSSATIYTYDLNATQDGNNVDINLTSAPGTDTSVVQLTAGPNITLDRVSATEIAISASAGSSGISDEARIFTWFSTMA